MGERQRRFVLLIAIGAALAGAAPGAAAVPAGNLLVNGDSETNEFSPWTTVAAPEIVPYGQPGGFPDFSVRDAIGGGFSFFAGGNNQPTSGMWQNVDLF